METQELTEFITRFDASATTRLSRSHKIQVLKLFRKVYQSHHSVSFTLSLTHSLKCRVRRPDIVLKIGKSVLDESNSLWNSLWSLFTDDNGSEKWLVCEQVFLAALDCNNKRIAEGN